MKKEYTYKIVDNNYIIYCNGKQVSRGGIFINSIWRRQNLNQGVINGLLIRKARREINLFILNDKEKN